MNSRAPAVPASQSLTRRAALHGGVAGLVGLSTLVACGTEASGDGSAGSAGEGTGGTGGGTGTGGTSGASATGGAGGTGGTTVTDCVLIPAETEGPYPLFQDLDAALAYTRSDITEGKPGVPLDLTLTVVDVNADCAPLAGAMVYIWHCDREGAYSGYSQPGIDETGKTYLRGVQATGADGKVTFATVFPGWYSGRITHIHFQVFLSESLAATSQLGFPDAIVRAVYDSDGYSAHGQNTSVTSFAADNVFADGTEGQIAEISGSPEAGYVASLVVGIAG